MMQDFEKVWSEKNVELVPVEDKQNILVTSALPYVNNVPHLGNIVGSVLSADVYSRYCKQKLECNVLYICATDEYGTATETAALMEGTTPQSICDKYYAIHNGIYKWFNIGFDYFGRSSNAHQCDITRSIFMDAYNNGFVDEASSEQLYCGNDKRFLADRFVEGTCKNCGYDSARGDQCDQCTNMLNPTDLINPKCKICGSTPYLKQTVHMYLNLPLLKDELEEWFHKRSEDGNWNSKSIKTTKAWLQKGLIKRSITRDLKWGVPLPEQLGSAYKDKVFYVWFDAPIGYISNTAEYSPENWTKWWLDNPSVKLIQFMGKDNTPFHTIVFPSSLIATRKNWTMLHTLSTTEYLLYEGGKFSKSRNVGVFGNQVQMTNLPPDFWRYYLISIRPESRDSDFSWSEFQLRINSDLADNIGNFCNRCIKFVSKYYNGMIPDVCDTSQAQNDFICSSDIQTFCDTINVKWQEYRSLMDKISIRNGLTKILELSAAGNEFFQKSKPWKLIGVDVNVCSTVLNYSISLVKLLAIALFPFTPGISTNLLKQLNFISQTNAKLLEKNVYNIHDAYITSLMTFSQTFPNGLIPRKHTICQPEILVSKISSDDLARYQSQFSPAKQ